MNEKIIFFGTHDFGAAMLSALFNSGYNIIEVITQPDRPVGRNQEIHPSPVKIFAEKNHLPVLQPETLRGFELKSPCDLIVVCQYGLIIPKKILDFPEKKSLNVHTSLLPKFRGASPIQSALVNGETQTGTTIILMDEKMDHGPILSQKVIQIDNNDTYPTLRKKMEEPSKAILLYSVRNWLDGKITPTPQVEADATFCKIFSREDGKIDWQKTPTEIFNQFRGLVPWPGVWTTWNSKRLKFHNLIPSTENIDPGIVKIIENKIYIGCQNGSIEILELQIEGKKSLPANEFLIGHQYFDGSVLK